MNMDKTYLCRVCALPLCDSVYVYEGVNAGVIWDGITVVLTLEQDETDT